MSNTRTTRTFLPVEDTGHPRRWLILAVLVVSLIVVVLDNTVLNVALKTLADPVHGLGATQGELAWMINSYTLVFAGLLFAFGVIGDRIGRRRILLAGLAVFGVASLLAAYSRTPEQLIGYRALMGAGAAAMMPATLSLVRAIFPEDEFPKALGVWTGAVGVGGAIGPIVGGSLLERFWWGSVFLINVPIVVLGIVLIALLAPESRGRQGKPDILGMALSVIALVLLTYGIIKAGDTGSWRGVEVWGTIALGVLGLAAFVWWERRTPHASLDMRLFRNPRFSSAAAIIALVFFAMLGMFFFMTFYIQIVRDKTPLEAGLIFVAFGIGMMIFAPLSGGFVARFGGRAVGLVALTLIGGTFAAISQFDVATPIALIVLLFFVQATGMASLMTPAMSTLMSAAPKEQAGVASALSNTLRQVGGAFGVAVLGTVMAQVYQARIAITAPGLSEATRTSLPSTYAAMESGAVEPAAVPSVMAAANEAFVGAMHVTAYAAVAITVVAMVIVARFFPGRRPRVAAVATAPTPPSGAEH
jgi:DHA2 family multidrug resistance protein-like MFS transporter